MNTKQELTVNREEIIKEISNRILNRRGGEIINLQRGMQIFMWKYNEQRELDNDKSNSLACAYMAVTAEAKKVNNSKFYTNFRN